MILEVVTVHIIGEVQFRFTGVMGTESDPLVEAAGGGTPGGRPVFGALLSILVIRVVFVFFLTGSVVDTGPEVVADRVSAVLLGN